jgi:adenosine kinase
VIVGADDAAAIALHVEQAGALGARLIFVPAQQIPALSDADLRRGLDQAWVVGGNDYEFEMIRERTGLSIDSLSASRMVAVTRGAAGSEIHSPDGVTAIPVAPVSGVVDPTGAGDAYIAGLVTGFRAGASPDVAGRMGSLAAAYVVEQNGPQRHRFDVPGFRDRYAAAFGTSLSLPSKTPA